MSVYNNRENKLTRLKNIPYNTFQLDLANFTFHLLCGIECLKFNRCVMYTYVIYIRKYILSNMYYKTVVHKKQKKQNISDRLLENRVYTYII